MQTPAMGASEPMFNLPRVVVLLAGVMVAMQLIQMLLPTEESLQFLLALAFIALRYPFVSNRISTPAATT